MFNFAVGAERPMGYTEVFPLGPSPDYECIYRVIVVFHLQTLCAILPQTDMIAAAGWLQGLTDFLHKDLQTYQEEGEF